MTIRYDKLPLNHATEFFREPNMAHFGLRIADYIARCAGSRTLNIAEIGCSSGEETWTMASMLTTNNLPWTIDAFDASPRKIAEAKRARYHTSMSLMAQGINATGFQYRCLDHFSYRGQGDQLQVRPSSNLRSRVNFAVRNIIEQSLPQGAYNVATMANVLFHYDDEDARNTMVSNTLNGLHPGGVFMIESHTRNDIEGYVDWVNQLPHHFQLQHFQSPYFHHPTIWRLGPIPTAAIPHL